MLIITDDNEKIVKEIIAKWKRHKEQINKEPTKVGQGFLTIIDREKLFDKLIEIFKSSEKVLCRTCVPEDMEETHSFGDLSDKKYQGIVTYRSVKKS